MTRCYNIERQAMDLARLEHYQVLLEKAYETEISIISGTSEMYRFDDGAGSQMKKEKTLDKLHETIDVIERKIDWLYRKLGGCLNVNIVQRRRQYRGISSL